LRAIIAHETTALVIQAAVLKPNSITLSGSKLVWSRFETGRRQV